MARLPEAGESVGKAPGATGRREIRMAAAGVAKEKRKTRRNAPSESEDGGASRGETGADCGGRQFRCRMREPLYLGNAGAIARLIKILT